MPIYSPSVDVLDGAWRTNLGSDVLAPAVGEEPADDSTYIQSGQSPSNDLVEIKFAPATDPQTNSGHIVRYRLRGDAGTKATVSLISGGTVVESWTHDPAPTTVTLFQQTLTNAGAISDYGDIHLRIVAGLHVAVPTNVQSWEARKMPASSPSAYIHSPCQFFNWDSTDPTVAASDPAGGMKHNTPLFCPADGKVYAFGGDYGGIYSLAELNQNFGQGVDARNGCFKYDYATDTWSLVYGEPGSGSIGLTNGNVTPWLPDWGHFCWDSKRNCFWHYPGGSQLAYSGGHGGFRCLSYSGLTWNYEQGRIPPDLTVVPSGSISLTDNTVNYIEYDPATHTIAKNTSGFTGSSIIPLYEVTTAAGAVTSNINRRPYWLTFGNLMGDANDPRRYGNPLRLLHWNPLAETGWTDDPTLRTPLDDNLYVMHDLPEDRLWSKFYQSMYMLYDDVADQLVIFGVALATGSGGAGIGHYDFATNHWSVHTYVGSFAMVLYFSRAAVIVSADRLLYFFHGSIPSNAYSFTGWTYNLDTHVFNQVVNHVGGQQGNCYWNINDGNRHIGDPEGIGTQLNTTAWLDAANNIIWWIEYQSDGNNPYCPSFSGRVYAIHAWHYKENRSEAITPPYDATNPPHMRSSVYIPTEDRVMGWGNFSDPVVPGSPLWPQTDPCTRRPYLYTWQPSGFTKPTWSVVP